MRHVNLICICIQSNLLTALEPPVVLKSEDFARNYENREEVLEAGDLTVVPSIEAPCITVCVQDISLYQNQTSQTGNGNNGKNGGDEPTTNGNGQQEGCDRNMGAIAPQQARTSQPCPAAPGRDAAGRPTAPLLLRDCSAP